MSTEISNPGPEQQPDLMSQDEIKAVRNAIVELEELDEPLAHVPDGDLTGLDELTAPVGWNETIAPTGLYRTKEGDIFSVTVFRNPDTSEIRAAVATVRRSQNELALEDNYRVGPTENGQLQFTKYTQYEVNESTDHDREAALLEGQLGDKANRDDAQELLKALDGAEPINLSDLQPPHM